MAIVRERGRGTGPDATGTLDHLEVAVTGESRSTSCAEIVALKERITSLAASIHAAEAEMSALVADLHQREGWTGWGIRSLAHWLTVNCGLTVAEAAARAEIAPRRADLPVLWAAFESGVLSVGSVRAAARVATPDTDAAVAEIAVTATAPQAARVYAAWRAGLANEAAEAERDAERRARDEGCATGGAPRTMQDPPESGRTWWRTWWDETHHLRVEGRLDPTTGAVLDTLLDKVLDDLRAAARDTPDADAGPADTGPADTGPADTGPADTGPADTGPSDAARDTGRPSSGRAAAGPTDGGGPEKTASPVWDHQGPSGLDALAELVRLAADHFARSGGRTSWLDRFAVTVTIDAEVLAGVRWGTGTLAGGTPIDAATVRRWLPDSTLEGLVLDRGRPLWLGRTVRLATRAQRRALLARDGGCAFPGCGRTAGLRAHHVVDWLQQGPTDITNMVLLCQRHHTLLHRGEYRIRMVDDLPVVESEALCDLRARGTMHSTAQSGPPRPPGPPGAPPPDPPRPLEHWQDRNGPPPRADAVRRSGEPLTRYGLDVLVGHLFQQRNQGRLAATAA
jgi:hypothetical protein